MICLVRGIASIMHTGVQGLLLDKYMSSYLLRLTRLSRGLILFSLHLYRQLGLFWCLYCILTDPCALFYAWALSHIFFFSIQLCTYLSFHFSFLFFVYLCLIPAHLRLSGIVAYTYFACSFPSPFSFSFFYLPHGSDFIFTCLCHAPLNFVGHIHFISLRYLIGCGGI